LVASCLNQFDEQAKQDDNIIIPEGKGLVRINVSNARTIKPSGLPSANTLYYTATFSSTNASSTVNVHTGSTAVAFGDLHNKAIPLGTATDWKVVITAWEGSSNTATANPIAGFTKTGITVVSTGSTSVEANLTAFLDVSAGSRNGTFAYGIIVPALPTAPDFFTVTSPAPSAYTTGSIEIFDKTNTIVQNQADGGSTPIGTSGVIDISAITTHSANLTLLPGYYTVRITLTASNCQDRVVEEALHIYSNKTSSWTGYTVPTLSQDKFSVAFDPGADTWDTSWYVGSNVTALDTQSGILNAGTATDPGVVPESNSGDLFDGWYDGSSATEWVFSGVGANLVFADKTLTAHWKAGAGVTVLITFDSGDGDLNIVYSKANPTYDELKGTEKITLVFSDTEGGTIAPSTIRWKWGSTPITAFNNNDTLVIDTGFGLFNLLTIGEHVINVSGYLAETDGLTPTETPISAKAKVVIK